MTLSQDTMDLLLAAGQTVWGADKQVRRGVWGRGEGGWRLGAARDWGLLLGWGWGG